MKFTLIIDPSKEEEVVATVHEYSTLTQQIEALILQYTGMDRITAYADEEIKILLFEEIECITVFNGKTFAVDAKNKKYRLKQRLYELEQQLPSYFIRINKSTLANENRIERYTATFSGSVDAVFRCGYREYVSRRCFSAIKRRYQK
jgi:DNA-binding LytR/AlgR family response regulator